MVPVIRAALRMQEGCRLRYDCPSQGGSYGATKFFEKYLGKHCTFLGYGHTLVGILDFQGRMPGVYENTKSVTVVFDDEDQVHEGLQADHFVLIDTNPDCIQLVGTAVDVCFLGDLQHEISFYPGDTVRFIRKPEKHLSDDDRIVREVLLDKSFTVDDIPRYLVEETRIEVDARIAAFHKENQQRPEEERLSTIGLRDHQAWPVDGDDIELIARGNVWALYSAPDELCFLSDSEEAAFWAQNGIARPVSNSDSKKPGGLLGLNPLEETLESAAALFSADDADIIIVNEILTLPGLPAPPPTYSTYKLLECWSEHRDRVRALNKRLLTENVA